MRQVLIDPGEHSAGTALAVRSRLCAYPGAVFGFTDWGTVMFNVSKSAATAMGRLFGKRPSVLLVSSSGHVHNHAAGVEVLGASAGGAESIVMLNTAAAIRFMALVSGGDVAVSVGAGGEVTVASKYGESVLDGDAMHETCEMPDFMGSGPALSAAPSKPEWTAVYTCTSADDTVPILNAAALVDNGGGVSLVATDRYRLVDVDVTETAVGALDRSVVVPRPLLMVAKSQPVKTRVSLNVDTFERDRAHPWIDCGDFRAWASEVVGDYPKVLNLFPRDPGEVRVTVHDSKIAAREAKALGKLAEWNTPIRVTVGDSVTLRVGSAEQEYAATIPATGGGEAWASGFNPKFFADALTFGAGEVCMSQAEPKKIATFTYSGALNVRSLLMPIIRFW